jgi:hypothetical protein
MLGIGIKNAILIILIILILHFVIKNILMNKTVLFPIKKEKFEPKKSSDSLGPQKCLSENLSSEKDKLLKFVFGDDMPKGDNNLDNFFKDVSKKILECDKDNYMECKVKSDDHRIPLASTCDPKMFELPSTDLIKKADICNTKKDLMILNEYTNESQMNGGNLYAGISAYDDFDQNYEQYSCKT